MKPKPLGGNRYELSSGQILSNVHGAHHCHGEFCTIHNPSTHHMAEWTQKWDGLTMTRVCPHSVGHPDPDSTWPSWIHICDGCCKPPTQDQMLADLKVIQRDLE